MQTLYLYITVGDWCMTAENAAMLLMYLVGFEQVCCLLLIETEFFASVQFCIFLPLNRQKSPALAIMN